MASSKSAKVATHRSTIKVAPASVAKNKRSSSKPTPQTFTKPHLIEFKVWSDIPSKLLAEIRSKLEPWLSAEDDEEFVDWSTTDLCKEINARMTPGSWLSGLREAHGWTQRELGERMGGVSPARISDWEHDRRSVSKAQAKILSQLFRVEPHRFF